MFPWRRVLYSVSTKPTVKIEKLKEKGKRKKEKVEEEEGKEETISRMQKPVAWNCASRVELIYFRSSRIEVNYYFLDN